MDTRQTPDRSPDQGQKTDCTKETTVLVPSQADFDRILDSTGITRDEAPAHGDCETLDCGVCLVSNGSSVSVRPPLP